MPGAEHCWLRLIYVPPQHRGGACARLAGRPANAVRPFAADRQRLCARGGGPFFTHLGWRQDPCASSRWICCWTAHKNKTERDNDGRKTGKEIHPRRGGWRRAADVGRLRAAAAHRGPCPATAGGSVGAGGELVPTVRRIPGVGASGVQQRATRLRSGQGRAGP